MKTQPNQQQPTSFYQQSDRTPSDSTKDQQQQPTSYNLPKQQLNSYNQPSNFPEPGGYYNAQPSNSISQTSNYQPQGSNFQQ